MNFLSTIDDYIVDNVRTDPQEGFVVKCSFCDALLLKSESTNLCCRNGKVKLPPYRTTEEHINFLKNKQVKDNIRKYNQILAFTSIRSKIDTSVCGQKGVYTFRVCGQLHHCYGSLYPRDSGQAKFLQIYLLDQDSQTTRRLELMKINKTVLEQFEEKLRAYNPYVQLFQQVGLLGMDENFSVIIHNLSGKTYNAPTVDEVGAIIKNFTGECTRDIIIYGCDNNIRNVSELHSSYDPLQYPVLLLFGCQGWHPNIPLEESLSNRCNISCREFYSYHLMKRLGNYNILHYGGKLFQQYVVDMYLKIDTERLRFQILNQKKMRADRYEVIQEAVRSGKTRAGRRILTSSYVGGPRYMQQKYQDAMAMVGKFGPPSLFITFTCSPTWKEILDALEDGQKAQDRPDIVARIFNAKLKRLIKDIMSKNIFGKCVGLTYSVEFQKRGLPHAHILVFLSTQYQVGRRFDEFVCAEIPNPITQKKLYDLVLRHMIHRPCEQVKTNCANGSKNGLCKNKFPKPFTNTSYRDENGYVVYRRRNKFTAERYYNGKKCTITDQHVVAYNPFLLEKYEAHINVEVASKLEVIKYLFKYVYKGCDKAIFSIKNQYDEIAKFEEGRYVGPVEACWRIFGFQLYYLSCCVIRLPIHLEGDSYIQFDDDANLEDILDSCTNSSQLTDFFRLCREHYTICRNLKYVDVINKCYWDRTKKCWLFRKRERSVVGRMYNVSPMEGERYYLRLLLSVVGGPRNFEDVRTYMGICYETYKEAAIARGLINTDDAHSQVLREMSVHQMPSALRHTFAAMLLFNEVNNAHSLFNEFRDALTNDIPYMYENLTDDQVNALAFYKINDVLVLYGKKITDFIQDAKLLECFDNENYDDVLGNLNNISNFTPEQKSIFDYIMESVKGNVTDKTYFINAPGGCGKTYLYNGLCSKLIHEGKNVVCVASSAIAASLLINGNTAHSYFNIPLNASRDSTCNINVNSKKAEEIRRADIIIWDEAPMSSKYTIEAVDTTLRDITECSDVNGGKVVVYGGDFRQTLPIVPNGTRDQIIESSFKNSIVWPKVKCLKLSTNLRTTDLLWNRSILAIGDGITDCNNDDGIGLVTLPNQVQLVKSIDQLINCIYFKLNEVYSESTFNCQDFNIQICDYFSIRNILCGTNREAQKINEVIINKLPGQVRSYISQNSIEEGGRSIEPDILNMIDAYGLPPHELILKKHVPVMLLRNINKKIGLCNGTRLLILNMYDNHLKVKIISEGKFKGSIHFLFRIFCTTDSESFHLKLKRFQFPIRLCFAMTINKSQGQGIDIVGVNLADPVFSHGQLYVALSRSTDPTNIYVYLGNADSEVTRQTKNIVYKEILDNG
jgi:PIF1-like helicase/Helitron helicase-like domain at N-terminus/Helicase